MAIISITCYLPRGAAMRPNARSSCVRTLFVALAVAVQVDAAMAMVVAKRDFPELVGRAEQIVVGTVTDIGEETDVSGMPRTLVTFSDLTVLKGDAGPTLTLKLFGGSSGRAAVGIPEMPRFALGERAVLFVAGNGRDICPLVGVWQGRFRVRHDAERGMEVVEDGEGRPLLGRSGRELNRAARSATAARPVSLDTFRQLIADELAHPTTTEPMP